MMVIAIFIGMVFIGAVFYKLGYEQGVDDGIEVGERMGEMKRSAEILGHINDPLSYISEN